MRLFIQKWLFIGCALALGIWSSCSKTVALIVLGAILGAAVMMVVVYCLGSGAVDVGNAVLGERRDRDK